MPSLPPAAAPSDLLHTIVLVDDDDALRAALQFALEIEGYGVESCRTGEQLLALDLPAGGCLVIDEKLEGVDGLESLEELRRRGVTLPAIMITSYAGPRLRSRARRAGASVVEKPLLCDALVAQIRKASPAP